MLLPQNITERQIAITIDDLPIGGSNKIDYSLKLKITQKLTEKLAKYRVPAIGFVNEVKLYENDTISGRLTALLKYWVDAGLELGNHTFSHPDYNKSTIESFAEEIRKGEIITNTIYKPAKGVIRYFRPPFLHIGTSIEARNKLIKLLADNNYAMAPVSVDNSDYIFAEGYARALKADNIPLADSIVKAYIPYMAAKIDYYENNSSKLFGRNIKHILLMHANLLNADHFDKLAEMLKLKGYEFVSLTTALTDTAYKSNDTYFGRGGISWLDRWALTQGYKGEFFKAEPRTPKFVLDAAGIAEE
jgi:peptidoglycan/xylan/chitin deacetylase (PgdA/CDA1 family)